MTKHTEILGHAEVVNFPELGVSGVSARIDTGARTSAIWASKVVQHDDSLEVVFFNQPEKTYWFDSFEKTKITSSTGHVQERFKIRLLIAFKGKKIRAWFTLADRSSRVYPVLIGRNVLIGKFIVDVKRTLNLKSKPQTRSQSFKEEG